MIIVIDDVVWRAGFFVYCCCLFVCLFVYCCRLFVCLFVLELLHVVNTDVNDGVYGSWSLLCVTTARDICHVIQATLAANVAMVIGVV